MANSYFKFKQFVIHQDACAMKVTTDACLFGAWCAAEVQALGIHKTGLDIGGGTGLLSLMVRQKNNVTIDVVEIDPNAAKQAADNCLASPWPNDFAIFPTDITTMNVSKTYDFIISNPPFYEDQLQSPNVTRNTAHHSKQLSLQHLVDALKENLSKSGTFFLLLPFNRLQQAMLLITQAGFTIRNQVVVHQTTAHAPFRVMLRGSNLAGNCNEGSICIKDAANQYTTEFRSLLHHYYLYL